MEIETSKIDEGLQLITMSGEMDLYNAKDLKDAVNAIMAESPVGIVVDLAELEYIDSSGISALLYTFTQTKARSIGLCFINIRGSVRKVIELTSLSGFFPIAASKDEAVTRLKANQ